MIRLYDYYYVLGYKNEFIKKVEIAFSKFDTNGDDKLDFREFCEMI